MSYMWSPEEALRTAQPVTEVVVDRRLRAQVWSGMIALNVIAWATGLWFVAATVL